MFADNGFNDEEQSKLWFDDTYGWSSINTFFNWIKITIMPVQKKNLKKAMQLYFKITEEQINSLTGPKSGLYN